MNGVLRWMNGVLRWMNGVLRWIYGVLRWIDGVPSLPQSPLPITPYPQRGPHNPQYPIPKKECLNGRFELLKKWMHWYYRR
jgi:hypothetical protein